MMYINLNQNYNYTEKEGRSNRYIGGNIKRDKSYFSTVTNQQLPKF